VFVSWYYRVSPALVRWISARGWALATARSVLAPIIMFVAYPFASLALLLSSFTGFATRPWLRRRRSGARS